MCKKMCGLFVVPLLLVCFLSSCKPEPKPEPKVAVVAPVKFIPIEPGVSEKRNHCLQVTGPADDDDVFKDYQYRYCSYPFNKADVTAGRSRCSTDVKSCINSSGECAKPPAQQKPC